MHLGCSKSSSRVTCLPHRYEVINHAAYSSTVLYARMCCVQARQAEHEKMVAKHPEMYGYNPQIHKQEDIKKSSNIITDTTH
jgi:hypothetical protein